MNMTYNRSEHDLHPLEIQDQEYPLWNTCLWIHFYSQVYLQTTLMLPRVEDGDVFLPLPFEFPSTFPFGLFLEISFFPQSYPLMMVWHSLPLTSHHLSDLDLPMDTYKILIMPLHVPIPCSGGGGRDQRKPKGTAYTFIMFTITSQISLNPGSRTRKWNYNEMSALPRNSTRTVYMWKVFHGRACICVWSREWQKWQHLFPLQHNRAPGKLLEVCPLLEPVVLTSTLHVATDKTAKRYFTKLDD